MSTTEPDRKVPPKKTALGRGLGSLLSTALPQPAQEPLSPLAEVKPAALLPEPIKAVPDHMRIWSIAIDKLSGHPDQPRKEFERGALDELAQSIRSQGILQPIVARRLGTDKFQIIAGERRWRAAQMAGLHEVPVIVREAETQKALELALIENIQRQDLNPIEEAMAYSHLLTHYNLTQQQLAEKVGKDRVTIANLVRLLNLSYEVQTMVASGQLSTGHAKVLLSVTDPVDQRRLALLVFDQKLPVRALERLVAQHNSREKNQSQPIQPNSREFDLSLQHLRDELQKIIGTKVTIDCNEGKGKISIAFYSVDELNGIAEKVRRSWQSQSR